VLLSALSAQVAGVAPGFARVLAAAAAVVLALVPVVGRPASPAAVRDWTRLRSVSETLKAEMYACLAGVAPYRGTDAAGTLLERTDRLARDASDLDPYVAGIEAKTRELPEVRDVDSYVAVRLRGQIDGYYRRRAGELRTLTRRLRGVEAALALLGAALSAAAAFAPAARLQAWVGVAATIGTAVAAHAAAQRYEYQQIEFARTADRLEDLLARFGTRPRTAEAEDAFVADCERIISIQNEGWMAKLARADGDGS
jgi:hypothetical protein